MSGVCVCVCVCVCTCIYNLYIYIYIYYIEGTEQTILTAVHLFWHTIQLHNTVHIHDVLKITM